MNERVQYDWDLALSLLQPTAGELQHGLELHRASVVIDAYGFAPRAAWEGAAYRALYEAGASDAELADFTEDQTMTRMADCPEEEAEFRAAWEWSGLTCIFQNAGEEGQAVERLVKRLARYTYTTDRMRDFLARAAWPQDIIAAHEQGRHCLYFSGNGVPLTQQCVSLEEELRFIRLFFQLGIRMMHMTYNRRNVIGDGCAEPANAGLSDFGRAVVAEMNRQGVIADVAHSGWQTALETAQCSTKPMVASHTVCAALNPHHRGKPDDVIRAICDTGGYVGIACVPAFLGRSGDLVALLDHIDHVVTTFGADHCAIGTDVAYTSRHMAAAWAEMPKDRRRQRPRWESFWQPNDALFDPRWSEERMNRSLAWTNWPLFTVGMVQRGHSDEDIQKILAGNVLRVARAVLER